MTSRPAERALDGDPTQHPTAAIYQLERRVKGLRQALQTIAQGRPDNITPEAWGEWCEVWARDELNADEVDHARR